MSKFNWSDGATDKLTIDDVNLEYACYGPPPSSARTIILLHEGLGSCALWKDFPKQLADETGFGVFVYSRQGYGKSDPVELPRPIDYMTCEAVDTLPKLLDVISFQSGILVGHSDGATIAAIYAGSIEDFRVRGLVLMAPHFFTEPDGLKSIRKAHEAYENSNLRERLAPYHNDVDHAFRGWCDAWLNPEFEAWNVSEVIDYFRIPTLAIQGRDDEYGTLAQLEEVESRSYAPVDLAILEDCGHSPHRDQPKTTLAEIKEFTARLARIEDEQVKLSS